jgi:hypothetical protein
MSQHQKPHPGSFHFRNLHPQILIGTASDRYAGWLNQIFSSSRYKSRITTRTNIIGGKSFTEEVLPVNRVGEYFDHFPVLEIDFTLYRTILDQGGQPTQNYQILKTYARHLKGGDRLILKVSQIIMAQKVHKGDQYVQKPAYLDPTIFTKQFFELAENLLDANLTGFIFEQEYQRKEDRSAVKEMALALDEFYTRSPKIPATIWNCGQTCISGTRYLTSCKNTVSGKCYRIGHGCRRYGNSWPKPVADSSTQEMKLLSGC